MTQEEFENRYRGRMLLFVTEAWTIRSLPPSSLGLMMDNHHARAMALLREIWKTANEPKGASK